MTQLHGVVPNMVTPMDAMGHPDKDGIHALVEFLVKAGVGGLWVLGSAGEDIHISRRDRIIVAIETIRAVDGRIPIIIGLGPSTWHEILDFCDRINIDTIDAVHFLPYDVKMGETALLNYILKLAETLPCPMWLYHNPKRGRNITRKIVDEAKSHPNIQGIKVGGYSMSELTTMMMLRSEDFDVVGAGGNQLFQMLCLGAQAHMTSDANCYPEVFLSVCDLFKQGRIEEARALQFRVIELAVKIPRTDNGEYAAEEKYILSKRKVCKEYVNPSYRTLAEHEKELLDDALKEYGFPWA